MTLVVICSGRIAVISHTHLLRTKLSKSDVVMEFIVRTKMNNIFRSISFNEMEIESVGEDKERFINEVIKKSKFALKYFNKNCGVSTCICIFSFDCSQCTEWKYCRGGSCWWVWDANPWWQRISHQTVQKLFAFFYWNPYKTSPRWHRNFDRSEYNVFIPRLCFLLLFSIHIETYEFLF